MKPAAWTIHSHPRTERNLLRAWAPDCVGENQRAVRERPRWAETAMLIRAGCVGVAVGGAGVKVGVMVGVFVTVGVCGWRAGGRWSSLGRICGGRWCRGGQRAILGVSEHEARTETAGLAFKHLIDRCYQVCKPTVAFRPPLSI